MLPYATLFDRQCRVVWVSRLPDKMTSGDVILHRAWEWSRDDAQADLLRTHFARCLVFGEEQHFETVAQFAAGSVRFLVWLYPSDLEDVGAVSIAIAVPSSANLLTKRERQVLSLLASGLAPKQIASRLKVARSTVETHILRCKAKLQLVSKESLIAFAVRFLSGE